MGNKLTKEVYDNLPDDLKKLTNLFTGRRKDIIFLSALGVLSNALPNVIGQYDSDNVYPHIYVIIIAPASSGKGVMKLSRLLVDKIHEKKYNDSIEAKNKCEEQNKKSAKKNQEICPSIKVFLVPGNISSAKLYHHMTQSEDGLLMFETETDTISNMSRNEWGNFDDLLRKSFHHERASISRVRDDVEISIKQPKLAIVLSGTNNQLQYFFKSIENGLYSRFFIYTFNEIEGFENVFQKKKINYAKKFTKVGDVVYNLYHKLLKRENGITFKLTSEQEKKFFEKFKTKHNEYKKVEDVFFTANVKRHGLMLYRVAMILSVLRNIDDIESSNVITCCDADFDVAGHLTFQLLSHSFEVYKTTAMQYTNELDKKIFGKLDKEFKRSEAIDVGNTLGVPRATMDNKLKSWIKEKYVEKLTQGHYKKYCQIYKLRKVRRVRKRPIYFNDRSFLCKHQKFKKIDYKSNYKNCTGQKTLIKR